MIFKNFKWIWVILALAVAVWCIGCSGSDDSTTWEQGDDFEPTPPGDVPSRIKDLKRLLSEETYNIITSESRDNPECIEANRGQFDPPLDKRPNGQWYYTYENLIKGMAKLEEFANEGDENTRKLEIAAFLANIAQETGAKVAGDPFGSPGCAIQEGYGADAAWHSCAFGLHPGEGVSRWGCNKTRPFDCPQWPEKSECPGVEVGYFGRGPHQLTYDVNYKAFGETMKVGDEYLKDPDLLTKEPEIGIAGSIWFWGHTVPNQRDPENPIPFKPSAHNVLVGNWEPTDKDIACGRKKPNFGVIINLINGGVECGKKTEGAENRVKYLEAIAKEMGVTIPEGFLDNCSTQENFAVCPSY